MSDGTSPDPHIQARLDELTRRVAELEQANQQLQRENTRLTAGALPAGEARFRALFDHAPDSFILIDGQTGAIVEFNDHAHQSLGYTREEFCRLRVHDIEALESPQEVDQHIRQLCETGSIEFETRHRTKSGHLRDVLINARTVTINGRLHFASVWTDITDRKSAEHALRQSEEVMRYIIKHDPNALAVYDRNLHYIAVSDRYLQDYNVTAADIIGKHHYEVFPEMPPRWKEVHQRVLQGATERNDDDCFERPDGSITYNRWECRPWYQVDGSIGGMITYTEVTTERKLAELALRDAVLRQEEAVRAANVGLWDWDLATNTVSYSAEWKSQIGYAEHEISNDFSEWQQRVHPDDLAPTLAHVEQAIAQLSQEYSVEFRFRHRDGHYLWILARASVIADNTGKPVRVLGSHLDITERKEAEEALRESERRVRAKLDAVLSPEGSFENLELADVIDVHAIQGIMDRFYNLTNIGVAIVDNHGQVLVATGWQDICTQFHRCHPDTARNCIESDTLLSQGIPPGQFKLYRCKNDMYDIATPLYIGDRHLGNLFLGQFFFDDEEPNRELFRARAQRFGFDEQSYLAALDRVPRWSHETVNCVMNFYAYFADLISHLSFGNLKLAQTLEQRRIAEEERARLEEQYRQAQKMEAVGQLAGGVAHDFNNILTAILGNVELSMTSLRKKLGTDHPVITSMEEIDRSAQRAAALTRQLLTFSRRDIAQPQILNLNQIIANLDRMLRRLITENIKLQTITDPDLHSIRADSGQLEQMIVNMVINAVHAMPLGGLLTLQTSNTTLDDEYARNHPEARPGPHILLIVADTGHGMDDATRQRIFEPFFTTKPAGKGSGLGLATVHGIVTRSGGHIVVETVPDQGTTFKIYLPATDQPAHEPAPTTNDEPLRIEHEEIILLCEDDSPVRDLIAQLLSTAGYSVITAGNGHEGLKAAQAHPGRIDLLVTDVIMPDMNGRALADRLRETRPHLPTLFISGYASEVIANHGILEDGVEFLEKPFTRQRLLEKIQAVLRNKQPSQ